MNLNKYLNPHHTHFFQNIARVLLFYGGANAGKSYSAVHKIILRCCLEKGLNILILRNTLPSVKKTCLRLMEQELQKFGVPYTINRSDLIMKINGNTIFFLSVNTFTDIDKLRSFTDIDMIWIEEADLLLEDAFDQLNLRMRGGVGKYVQLLLTFNPVSTVSWVYHKLFVNQYPDVEKIKVNIDHNPYATEQEFKVLDNLKDQNYNKYKVYRLGEFGELMGTIYTNYSIVSDLPSEPDETFYGVDFGYNNQSAVVKIMIKDQQIYVQELLYETHLTNTDLIAKMEQLHIGRDLVYPDCAEPDRIEELRRAGFRCIEADKSVSDGIDFCQSQHFFVYEESINLISEAQSYVWAVDKDNKPLDIPVKYKDHLLDAMRYGMYTHLKKRFDAQPVAMDNMLNRTGNSFDRFFNTESNTSFNF